MKKWSTLFVLFCVATIASVGCGGDDESSDVETHGESEVAAVDDNGDDGDDAATDVVYDSSNTTIYCGSCGQLAGTVACCDESAETCEDCNRAKGAPLCCHLGQHYSSGNVCGLCGVSFATIETHQCDASAEICKDCNLVKHSALCCIPGLELPHPAFQDDDGQ